MTHLESKLITSSYCMAGLHHPKACLRLHFLPTFTSSFPGARIDLQIALGCGKHLICVCMCVCASNCEKGLPPFALRLCSSFTGLSGMLTMLRRQYPGLHVQCQVVIAKACRGQRASIWSVRFTPHLSRAYLPSPIVSWNHFQPLVTLNSRHGKCMDSSHVSHGSQETLNTNSSNYCVHAFN